MPIHCYKVTFFSPASCTLFFVVSQDVILIIMVFVVYLCNCIDLIMFDSHQFSSDTAELTADVVFEDEDNLQISPSTG